MQGGSQFGSNFLNLYIIRAVLLHYEWSENEGKFMDKKSFRSFRLNYQVAPDSSDGLLVAYLDEMESLSRKDAMLKAIRSYWLPLALEKAGVRRQDLERAGYEAVLDLVKQANYICAVLDLDPHRLGLAAGVSSSARAVKVVPSESESKGESPEKEKKELSQWDEITQNFEYEDLGFGDWPVNE
jgi:hypothetical protein